VIEQKSDETQIRAIRPNYLQKIIKVSGACNTRTNSPICAHKGLEIICNYPIKPITVLLTTTARKHDPITKPLIFDMENIDQYWQRKLIPTMGWLKCTCVQNDKNNGRCIMCNKCRFIVHNVKVNDKTYSSEKLFVQFVLSKCY
jgi:hypothetical protein